MEGTKRKTISQEMADIRLEIEDIGEEIAALKNKRSNLEKEYAKKKRILDNNFSSLFNFYRKNLIGENNFKTGQEIFALFPQPIRNTYGINILLKKLTDAAAEAGYYRHVRYSARQRHYAYFKTKQK